MCNLPNMSDPAMTLASVLNDEPGITVSTSALRRVIGRKWDRIRTLAHAIHDEETSERRRLDDAIKYISQLSEEGLRNIINKRGCAEAQETWRLVVDASRR